MGTKFLGKKFDIHGGGRDLIFPHHENELAQSEGANGVEPVKYWVHNGFVNINKEKMSKSLGNFFTIREITKQYDPETIRFFLLSGHYRSPIDFSDQNLKEAKINLDRFYDILLFADKQIGALNETASEELKSKFCSAMDDDFNSAAAIGHLNNELRSLNGLRDKVSSKNKSIIPLFSQTICAIKECGLILGIFNQNPSTYFEKDKKKHLNKNNITNDWILSKIEDRRAAREDKRWSDADKIRDELLDKGITLLDSKKETEWKLTSCSSDEA
jgi:cysteinyl-tRNA synthetase